MNIEVSKEEFENIKAKEGVISFKDTRNQEFCVFGELIFVKKLKQSEAESQVGQQEKI